jgi:hypothetical protein
VLATNDAPDSRIAAADQRHLRTELGDPPAQRGQELLVGQRAQVQRVIGALEPLELDRIEQEGFVLLDHRQHGPSRRRGPAAEHRPDAALARHELPRRRREARVVRGAVRQHRLHAPPADADATVATRELRHLAVDEVDRELRGRGHVATALAERPGEREQHAHAQRRLLRHGAARAPRHEGRREQSEEHVSAGRHAAHASTAFGRDYGAKA